MFFHSFLWKNPLNKIFFNHFFFSLGIKTAEINVAEGQKQAKILESGNLLNIYLPNILNSFVHSDFMKFSFF